MNLITCDSRRTTHPSGSHGSMLTFSHLSSLGLSSSSCVESDCAAHVPQLTPLQLFILGLSLAFDTTKSEYDTCVPIKSLVYRTFESFSG